MPSTRPLEEALNSVAPEHSNVHVIDRGVPKGIDPILKGQERFARKTGTFMAVLNADNVFTAKTRVKHGITTFKVDRILKWMELDCLISFGPDLEIVEVKDIDDDEDLISIKNDTLLEHEAERKVLLYAVPFKTTLPVLKGDDIINVASRYDVLPGDAVTVKQNDKLSSIKDHRVEEVELVDEINSPDGLNKLYKLKVKEKFTLDIEKESRVYLRAFPAYVSRKLVIPKQRFSNQGGGPFLIDYMSARLKEIEDIEEVLSISLFNSSNISITGNSLLKIKKNFFVPSDFNLDSLLFWELNRGCINLKNGRIEGELDDDGKFFLYTDILPKWGCKASWKVKFKANTPLTARVCLFPKGFEEITIPSDGSLVTLDLNREESDDDTSRIEVVVLGPPRAKFSISSWLLSSSVPNSLTYSLLARVTSLADWQSTGLMIKPFFYSLDYLKAKTEIEDNDLAILHT